MPVPLAMSNRSMILIHKEEVESEDQCSRPHAPDMTVLKSGLSDLRFCYNSRAL